MEVSEGQVLAGKYRIERVLGRGAMGLVVAATHLQLGERVALKFLLPEALQNPDAVARFEREARAAVRIKSEHVARVSDVGTLESGAPYMVMEYLEGIDLSAWLQQRGALYSAQAVDFVLQACEAIAEAHALGIVHRDLKPANLFVVERSDGLLAVKVLDFGISKFTGLGDSAGMTKTTAVMGSPLYMSPEQMQSAKDVDVRGDIWALGVVLYELLSRVVPFPGETMAELVLKVVAGPPVPLSAVCAHAPPGLEAVVLKCLEKDRAARYQSVADLASALSGFAPAHSRASIERITRVLSRAGTPVRLSSSPPLTEPANLANATQSSWGQGSAPTPHRRRALVIAAVLFVVAVLAVGSVAFMRSGQRVATTTASAASPITVSLASLSAEPVATPSSSPSSTPSAASSASVSVAVTPTATSRRPAGPAASAASAAAKPAFVARPVVPTSKASAPPPAAAKSVPPAPASNPLKMPLQ
ncbi:MAG TPA: serine/threonine-protein kinase [Polyangiaceae bacterium]|nr:serine/threonine-protein kinase [Polyangiaceae bacterium]